jgi:hypothetical protein
MKDLRMMPSQLWGPRAAAEGAAKAIATAVASPATGHANATSPMRTTLPACPTPSKAAVTAGPVFALVASLVQRVAGGDAPEEEKS